ncbi:MAG: mechanosensitive ion channel [Deltaproteobacteria bacterium]
MPAESKTLQIFNDFSQINFAGIVEIFVVSWILIWLVKNLFPWLANRIPGRLRLYLLPSVPVIRLVILIAAIVLIVPMVISFDVSSVVTSDGALRMFTFDDTVVTIPHIKIWESNIYNANDGKRNLLCVANFFVNPNHDAALVRQKLHDVALTSPFLDMNHPIRVIVQEQPWGTHYQLKAYPLDGRDQFLFVSDLTVRGKAALARMGVNPAQALPAPATQDYTGRTGNQTGQSRP